MEIKMTDKSSNFNYSLVQNDEGNFVVRSTVNSFNLDHVTDKDIVSFYNRFSQYASFDTGLLPLDGTGVLAIRSAGRHAQIVTQHIAGMYHINWGASEGDPNAKTYYVAQPYRIVIGDFLDGNLLGARMFYSPYPITNPSQTLYHVNLPNINCKGYRGNGVGWICLYLKENWSELPFNEKVARFIERCSGVETYNDANMSETDGPRFYAENKKPSHFYDPNEWQEKSASEGFAWTLDPNLLIPVCVKDLDNQDKHYSNGQPLTLAMAMLGNYQAYYTDNDIPKMYNLVSRQDLSLNPGHIADMFKVSFAKAPSVETSKNDPYNASSALRESLGSSVFIPSKNSFEEDEDSWCCTCCEELYPSEAKMFETHDDGYVCEDCLNERYVYIESANSYFYIDNSSVTYVENQSEFFHEDYDIIWYCDSCSEPTAMMGNGPEIQNLFHKKHVYETPSSSGGTNKLCRDCFVHLADEEDYSLEECDVCSKTVICNSEWQHVYPNYQIVVPKFDENMNQTFSTKWIVLCTSCKNDHIICPCGLLKPNSEDSCTITSYEEFETSDFNSKLVVNSACSSCVKFDATEDSLISKFVPFNPEVHQLAIEKATLTGMSGIHFHYENIDEAF